MTFFHITIYLFISMAYKNIQKRREAGMRAYQKRKEKRWPELLEKSRIANRKYYWRHSFVRLIQNLKKNEKETVLVNAFDLWKIAKRQRLICPMTGRKLTNDTLSIDHVKTKSKGGLTTVENLRLVHVHVNYAKHSLLDEEFLSLCEDVINYKKRNG